MKYRKLDSQGDYTFGLGPAGFYTGTTAVAQAIYTSLRLLQGEWWEDTSRGLPLFQSILGQPGTPEHVRAIDMLVQETILKVQDVVQIKSFQSSYANRQYAIQSCVVQTKYGDVVLEGVTL